MVAWSTPPEQPPGRDASPEAVADYIEELWHELLWELPIYKQRDCLIEINADFRCSWSDIAARLKGGPLEEAARLTEEVAFDSAVADEMTDSTPWRVIVSHLTRGDAFGVKIVKWLV